MPHILGLLDEIKWINARSSVSDLAVEVHLNSGGGIGTETYFYAGSNISKKFAQAIQNKLVQTIKTKDRGVKPDTATRFGRLGFIRDTKPLATLVEAFFIQENISTKEAGRGIARGLIAYRGLKLKSVPLKKISFTVPNNPNIIKKIKDFIYNLIHKK